MVIELQLVCSAKTLAVSMVADIRVLMSGPRSSTCGAKYHHPRASALFDTTISMNITLANKG
jgi:hypothetical protein